MGGTHNMHWGDEQYRQNVITKSEGKEPLEDLEKEM
jgi:hypothetical protein